jgi:hypothetical protein
MYTWNVVELIRIFVHTYPFADRFDKLYYWQEWDRLHDEHMSELIDYCI